MTMVSLFLALDIDQVLLLDTFESLFQICGRTIRQLSTEDNK